VPRGGVVNARRPGHRPGRSEAESIDDVEHGISLIGAMVVQFDSRTNRGHVLQKNSARARANSCGRHRHVPLSDLAMRMDTQAALFSCTDRARRQRHGRRASDGVNDPVRAPWGQVPGTAAGSFTPSFPQ
jgi:hypothetical protein